LPSVTAAQVSATVDALTKTRGLTNQE